MENTNYTNVKYDYRSVITNEEKDKDFTSDYDKLIYKNDNKITEIIINPKKYYGLDYKKRRNFLPKLIENTNIYYYERIIYDDFDQEAKTNRGLYIMNKWSKEDVEKTIHDLLKKYRIKILWSLVKISISTRIYHKLIHKQRLQYHYNKMIADELKNKGK